MPSSTIWGPGMWDLLLFTNYYGDVSKVGLTSLGLAEVQALLTELYDSLQWVLPCYDCRLHYTKYLNEIPDLVTLFECPGSYAGGASVAGSVADSKIDLSWTRQVFELHNWVNVELSKKAYAWSALLKRLPPRFSANTLVWILQVILKDDICKPNINQAIIARQSYASRQFNTSRQYFAPDDRICIADFQINRFCETLLRLFEIYKSVLGNTVPVITDLTIVLQKFLKSRTSSSSQKK